GLDLAAVAREIIVAIVIPAAHRVDRYAITVCAEHLVHGHAGALAENVPYGDIGGGDRELHHAVDAVVFKRLPQLGANAARKRRVLANDHGLHFLLEDRLHPPRSAGDHAERSARPAGDARVRLEAEYDAAAIDAEPVDGVVLGCAGGALQDVGFERSNPDLF